MHFYEELLMDERYLKLNGNQQSELIANHCAYMEDRILSAQSRQKAIRIKEMACIKFKQECQGELLSTALIRHIERT